MENFVPTHLQEIIYSSSDKKVRKQIALLESAGKIKKIAPRIFTSNFIDTDEVIIKRNIFCFSVHLKARQFKDKAGKFAFSVGNRKKTNEPIKSYSE